MPFKKTKTNQFLTANKPKLSRHSRAGRARWSVQRRLDLETAHDVFAHVEGGLLKAFLDRLQMSVLRAHEPLSMESLSIAVRILGNIRVDRFKLVDRACGLARIITLFLDTRSRAQMLALRSELFRHFEETRRALRKYEAQNGTGSFACRSLFIELAPMRPDDLGLVVEQGEDAGRRYIGPVTRITMMKGNKQITHACIRTKEVERSAVRTEADAFACAAACGSAAHPDGLFVCDPQDAAQSAETPDLPLTLKPLDPIETTAAFIVQACRAYREGSPIAVTVADFTGVLDPARLREAVLRHPIKTEVIFAYLPCEQQSDESR